MSLSSSSSSSSGQPQEEEEDVNVQSLTAASAFASAERAVGTEAESAVDAITTTTTTTMTEDAKAFQMEFLRRALPACQPQEASPANTFTNAELDELRNAITSSAVVMTQRMGPLTTVMAPSRTTATTGPTTSTTTTTTTRTTASVTAQPQQLMPVPMPFQQRSRSSTTSESSNSNSNKINIFEDSHWNSPSTDEQNGQEGGGDDDEEADSAANDDGRLGARDGSSVTSTWHGAPKMKGDLESTRGFRSLVRAQQFQGPTNAVCPGFMQCNLVILPQSDAFDFLLFCQRNPKACPLIEVCDVGSPHPVGIALDADLRTDLPKYAIYRDGKLETEVPDILDHWRDDLVAFLIGCSFSYDGALLKADIPLKSADAGKNVPMYRTNLPCRSAGRFRGTMVVSMKPIKAVDVAREVSITAQYPHAHGTPVCVGNAKAIGIADMAQPEWGDPIDVALDEVPVFHACGVTPQSVLMDSRIPFAITHSAGHMFVTDLPADTTF